MPGDVQLFRTWGPGFLQGKNYIIRLVARLKPGVTPENAQRDFDRVAQEIRGSYSEFAREDLHFTIAGMQADAFRDVKPALTDTAFSATARGVQRRMGGDPPEKVARWVAEALESGSANTGYR